MQLQSSPHVVAIRGSGLMIGVEINRPCAELVAQARDKGVLINVASGNVVRLVPPLNINEEESDFIIETISDLIKGQSVGSPGETQ